jgi:hypothetical protein
MGSWRPLYTLFTAALLTMVSLPVPDAVAGDVGRRIVHPHDPAPTLAEDVAAITFGTVVSLPRGEQHSGVDPGLVGGLQTLRLMSTIRDVQRVPVTQALSSAPGSGGVTCCTGVTFTASWSPPVMPLILTPPPGPITFSVK